jgi:heat shock protein HslJ
MMVFRLIAGRHGFVCGALALALTGLAGAALGAQPFPFDQVMLLDVKPMRPVKRVPILTVARNGEATIGLWCKTVRGRVELTDNAIRIEPGPLPEGLPQYMVDGQCSDARMQADQETLAALSQVTGWRRQGQAVLLLGPRALKFRPSDN